MGIAILGYSQKVKIEKIVKEKKYEDGVFFALPNTIIHVEIDIVETDTKTGKFLKNAELIQKFYTGPIISKSEKSLEIGEISVTTKSGIDPVQIYWADIEKKWLKNQNFTFNLGNNYSISGANISTESKVFEIVTTGLSSIASIAGQFAGARSSGAFTSIDMSSSNLSAAELSAINLLELLNRRTDLLGATRYGGDEGAFNKMLEELDKAIQSELVKFTGTSIKRYKKYQYDYVVPAIPTKSPIELFTLNGADSIITYHVKNDHYVYPEIKNVAGGKKIDVELELKQIKDQVTDFVSIAKPKKMGMPYRLPGKSAVQVLVGGTPKAASTHLIAQQGKVAYLPYRLNEVNLEYFAETGGIKTLTAKGNAITTDQIKAAESTSQSIIDAIKGDDELTKIQKENELLEAQKTNKALKEELSIKD